MKPFNSFRYYFAILQIRKQKAQRFWASKSQIDMGTEQNRHRDSWSYTVHAVSINVWLIWSPFFSLSISLPHNGAHSWRQGWVTCGAGACWLADLQCHAQGTEQFYLCKTTVPVPEFCWGNWTCCCICGGIPRRILSLKGSLPWLLTVLGRRGGI